MSSMRKNQDGQGLTEYLILLVLISLVSIAAVRSLGGTIQRKLELVQRHINDVSPDENRRSSDSDSHSGSKKNSSLLGTIFGS